MERRNAAHLSDFVGAKTYTIALCPKVPPEVSSINSNHILGIIENRKRKIHTANMHDKNAEFEVSSLFKEYKQVDQLRLRRSINC